MLVGRLNFEGLPAIGLDIILRYSLVSGQTPL